MGKIGVRHIPVVKELLSRNVLKPVPILPTYIKNQRKIELLKNAQNIIGLVKRRRK
jgi:hypothetical protein